MSRELTTDACEEIMTKQYFGTPKYRPKTIEHVTTDLDHYSFGLGKYMCFRMYTQVVRRSNVIIIAH